MLEISVVIAFSALVAAVLAPCVALSYGSGKSVLAPTLIGSAVLNALFLGVLAVCHANSKHLAALAFTAVLLSALACYFSCMFVRTSR